MNQSTKSGHAEKGVDTGGGERVVRGAGSEGAGAFGAPMDMKAHHLSLSF
jgi:hypothetical protein